MRTRWGSIALVICGLVLAWRPAAQGQQTNQNSGAAGGSAAPRRVARAALTTAAPVLDGVLDEGVWQQATPLTDFTQSEPLEGQPSSERTEVRILYDNDFVYVGVMCYDRDAEQILITDSRRDSGLGDTDSFQMIFDTYLDRQNGFVFGTNAAGIQYDAQVRNEGQSGSGGGGGGGAAFGGGARAQSGSGGGTNVNWDASWDVRARISDSGWSAEFRIPLRTFRYGMAPQAWGLNFVRNIPRNREVAYWAPIARQFNISRLSSAGELQDLQLRTPRNFKLTPYAVASANRNYTPGSSTQRDREVGFDTKFGITPSLNLDLTYNTDFAQVEVDEQQINLTRFNLVVPEKRPFFLENAGLFSVGSRGDVDLFFSRRIGIAADGSLVPIRGGARLSGRLSGLNVGVLDIQTEEVGTTPANNFAAVRLNRELPNRSSIGAIFVNRAATGSPGSGSGAGAAGEHDWNRTWGVDGRLGIGEAITFNGYAARTETPGLTEGQYAVAGGAEYRDRRHRTYFEYAQVGDDFNPEVGFLRRDHGSERIAFGFYETLRSEALRAKGFRELLPHFSYVRYNRLDGSLETATLHLDNHFDWESGNYIAPAINIDWDGLDRPFEVYPGVIVPKGTYRATHTAFRTHTDGRKWISANFDWDYGSFLSGHQSSIAPALTVRRGGKLSASLRWARNDIDLPEGDFVTNLGSMRATYNFSTSV
ncbi:MAG: carbohydrate binding family 9 domain-containing protein, partial [Gemmatimonadetes bacterium]|nr:carbohydrate binding family 9 domain-containing protein [Gemmatimonadota bacterium]